MIRTVCILGSTVGGWVGWWAGDHVGITTAVMLSAVGSGLGFWAARRFMDRIFD